MSFLVSSLPVLHLFAVAAACSWVFGGQNGPALAPWTPWLAFFTLEAMFFPQCREGESFSSARARAWGGLVKDPLFYAAAALAIYLAIPFFNASPCWICDADLLPEGDPAYLHAPVRWLPTCTHTTWHYSVFTWFVLPAMAALAVKHALRKRGRRALLEMMCWNGAALAVLGMAQSGTSAKAPFWGDLFVPSTVDPAEAENYSNAFFSSFPYANAAACFFTMLFAVSCGIWQSKFAYFESLPSHKEFEHVKPPSHKTLRSHYMLAVAVLNFLGALHTGSRAGWIASIALGAVMALHIFCGYFQKAGRLGKTRILAAGIGLMAFVALTVAVFAPEKNALESARDEHTTAEARSKSAPSAKDPQKQDESKKRTGIDHAISDFKTTTQLSFFDRLTGRVPTLGSRAAWKIFADNPAYGIGGWGFIDTSAWMFTEYGRGHWPELNDADWQAVCKQWVDEATGPWTAGVGNVHNDYLQFLCEHGLVGVSLLAILMALLMRPVFSAWRRLCSVAKFSKGGALPARPFALYVLQTPVYGVIFATAAAAIHALADCPLRCAANTSCVILMWACAGGYLPSEGTK